MIYEQTTTKIDYVKRLEEENKLLRKRILTNMLNDNIEIDKLNSKINSLEKEITNLKKQNARILLFKN